MNRKRIKLFLVAMLCLVLAGLVFIYFKNNNKISVISDDRINVATSFYPIYFLTSEIGGDLLNVINITPAGTEPHDYEPTAQDILQIGKSELLFLNGGGLEVWSEKVLNVMNLDGPKVVVVGEELINKEAITLRTNEESEYNKAIQKDPHVWLDPVLMIRMAEKISTELSNVDLENATYYQNNLGSLKNKLVELDSDYEVGLQNCKTRNFVTAHSAFGYLAERYELNQISIAGLSPEEEPSSRQLAKVAEFAKENQLKYIFFESLTNPKLSETIAKEVGAQTLVLNPIEGLSSEDASQGKNYFTEMEKNLENLKVALECN